jgi:hypothetical protein
MAQTRVGFVYGDCKPILEMIIFTASRDFRDDH